jgi:hypothetical protein
MAAKQFFRDQGGELGQKIGNGLPWKNEKPKNPAPHITPHLSRVDTKPDKPLSTTGYRPQNGSIQGQEPPIPNKQILKEIEKQQLATREESGLKYQKYDSPESLDARIQPLFLDNKINPVKETPRTIMWSNNSSSYSEFFLQNLLQSADSLPITPLWFCWFDKFHNIYSNLDVDNQFHSLDGEFYFANNRFGAAKESMCVLYAQGVKNIGDGFEISRHGYETQGAPRGLVSSGRKDFSTLSVTYLETDNAFTDTFLRPWMIRVSHYGVKGTDLKTSFNVMELRKTPDGLDHRIGFRYHNAYPINIDTYELNYEGSTIRRREVEFAFSHYIINSWPVSPSQRLDLVHPWDRVSPEQLQKAKNFRMENNVEWGIQARTKDAQDRINLRGAALFKPDAPKAPEEFEAAPGYVRRYLNQGLEGIKDGIAMPIQNLAVSLMRSGESILTNVADAPGKIIGGIAGAAVNKANQFGIEGADWANKGINDFVQDTTDSLKSGIGLGDDVAEAEGRGSFINEIVAKKDDHTKFGPVKNLDDPGQNDTPIFMPASGRDNKKINQNDFPVFVKKADQIIPDSNDVPVLPFKNYIITDPEEDDQGSFNADIDHIPAAVNHSSPGSISRTRLKNINQNDTPDINNIPIRVIPASQDRR